MTSRASPGSQHTLQTRIAKEPYHKRTKGKNPGTYHRKAKDTKDNSSVLSGNPSRELMDKCPCESQEHSVSHVSERHRHPVEVIRHRDRLCDNAAASLWGWETPPAEPCCRQQSTSSFQLSRVLRANSTIFHHENCRLSWEIINKRIIKMNKIRIFKEDSAIKYMKNDA